MEKHGCSAGVECRLGDGLCALKPCEADDIVIAGCTGVTAAAILGAAQPFWQPGKRFVFVPATGGAQSCAAGFGAMAFLCWTRRPVQAAGRFYTVMCAEYTGQVHTPC